MYSFNNVEKYLQGIRETISAATAPQLNIQKIVDMEMFKVSPVRQMMNDIKAASLVHINQVVEGSLEAIKKMGEEQTLANEYYNLPIHFDFSLDYLIDFRGSFKKGEAQDVIERSFIEEFEDYVFPNMIKNWSSSILLEKRKSIFDDVVKAYDMGLYSAVVPTVTVQIEGIVCEKVNVKSISTKGLIRVAEYLFSSKFFIDDITKKYYVNVILKNNHPDPNNRHGIAHGSVYNYSKKINAVKAIVIFDSLLKQLERGNQDELKQVVSKQSEEDIHSRVRRNIGGLKKNIVKCDSEFIQEVKQDVTSIFDEY